MTLRQRAKLLTQYSTSEVSLDTARALFPEFKWRTVIAQDQRYTRVVLSIDDGKPDPRTYEEMRKHGEWDDEGVYHRRRSVRAPEQAKH